MRRGFRVLSRFFVMMMLLGTILFSVVFFFLLNRYPWTVVSKNFGITEHFRLLTDWPMNPMVEELHKRKKKRLPKAEMQRIYDLDVRRMSFINIPIMDLFSSSQVKFLGVDSEFRSLGFSEFPWPWFETSRTIGDGAGPQRVSYVTVPTSRGVRLVEGVLLAPGEELEFSFPLTKIRRVMRFFVLPMNTGTLRVSLGQSSWARTFEDAELMKPQFVSIPINDASAVLGRISATSSKVFLLGAQIAQSEMSGRHPIQVLGESSLWSLNPIYQKEVEKELSAGADASESGDEEAVAESPQASGDGKGTEDGSPTAPDSAVVPAVVVPSFTPTAAPTLAQNADASSGAKEEGADSLRMEGNPQVLVHGGKTLALGYNVLVLHAEEFPDEILSETEKLERYAPAFAALAASSIRFELPAQDSKRSFRSFVLGDGLPEFQQDLPILLRDAVAQMEPSNLYRHFRDYGYHVWGAAPATFFGFGRETAWINEASVFSERWLDSNDWNFVKKRIRIDRDAQPVQGLEAVFQTKDVSLAPPLVTSDYNAVSKYFSKLSANADSFPDWSSNEFFLPDERDAYTASVVNYFQNWIDENKQQRFLGHLWLGGGGTTERPSLKDFAKVLKAGKVGGGVSELWHGRLGKVTMMDRAFAQIDDALHVRRLSHRTLIVLLIPHGKSTQVLVKIPGVIPIKHEGVRSPVSMDDLRATLTSLLGLPLESRSFRGSVRISGRLLETSVGSPVSEASTVSPYVMDTRLERFVLRVSPGQKRCEPFWWRSRRPIQRIEATAPIFEMAPSRMEFKVFPCAVKSKMVSIDWFQHGDNFALFPGETRRESALRRLGGEFQFEQNIAAGPEFLFGENGFRATHPVFSHTNHVTGDLDFLFMRPWMGGPNEAARSAKQLEMARLTRFSPDSKDVTFVLFARENSIH
jgi:hypothetical protein